MGLKTLLYEGRRRHLLHFLHSWVCMIDILGGRSIKPRWEQWVRLSLGFQNWAGRAATTFCKPRALEPFWGNRMSAQLHRMTLVNDSCLECLLTLLCMFVCVPSPRLLHFLVVPKCTGKASLAWLFQHMRNDKFLGTHKNIADNYIQKKVFFWCLAVSKEVLQNRKLVKPFLLILTNPPIYVITQNILLYLLHYIHYIFIIIFSTFSNYPEWRTDMLYSVNQKHVLILDQIGCSLRIPKRRLISLC